MFQCSPYHYKDRVVIMGDAAHAMVPFYGQGCNCVSHNRLNAIYMSYTDPSSPNVSLQKPEHFMLTFMTNKKHTTCTYTCRFFVTWLQGFEDCLVFDQILEKHNNNLGMSVRSQCRFKQDQQQQVSLALVCLFL